jgi:hypothetical protein
MLARLRPALMPNFGLGEQGGCAKHKREGENFGQMFHKNCWFG